MKARVRATEEVVDVHRICMSSQGDIWQSESGKEYFAYELDFDVKEPPKPRYSPDYWTRLEHQYAGMAMQGMITHYGEIDEMGDLSILTNQCVMVARDLVGKLKQKEESK